MVSLSFIKVDYCGNKYILVFSNYMSKLAPENKFLDFSDYGRAPARVLAKSLVNTKFIPVHITILFMISGLYSAYFMLKGEFVIAGALLVIKSILDAADGELARLRNKPSYIGRYLDSVFDLILNFILLFTINTITQGDWKLMVIAFVALQLQGTVFNYYYLIVRNNMAGGDTTSRIKENSFPKALHGENQWAVNILFVLYSVLYGGFDRIIIALDSKAQQVKNIPGWFMSFVSLYGLGFQLLVMAVMLAANLIHYIIPFFIIYSLLIVVLILIRKIVITPTQLTQK
ncbi:MAG: phosphatidylglycerophosphate synthase [Saprospiraceae bacterium]|jgi:phosphatidylglycerophosphate synthase